MILKYRRFFSFLILLLFGIWITLGSYLYLSGFEFETYFSSLELNIYSKVCIVAIIYIFRNYLFIPSTLAILFAWFFLQNFWLTLCISILWVSFWICQTYFIWYIFAEDIKNHKHFHIISRYKNKIEKDGYKVIFLWSFFPIIPVDILYYSAWFIKYHFLKTYLAWILWEMPLIILYVYLGKEAYKYSDYFAYIAVWIVIIYIFYKTIKKLLKKEI